METEEHSEKRNLTEMLKQKPTDSIGSSDTPALRWTNPFPPNSLSERPMTELRCVGKKPRCQLLTINITKIWELCSSSQQLSK